MDSKTTLEGSVTATPASASVRHSISRRESIELMTLNQPRLSTAPSVTDKSTDGAVNDASESRREMIALAAVSWTQFMVNPAI
jgi:hypothetical protein